MPPTDASSDDPVRDAPSAPSDDSGSGAVDGRDIVTFGDLATATYCPRKLYYARRESDRSPPERAETARALAGRYDDLLVASDAALETFDLAVSPERFRTALARGRERFDRWPDLVSPAETDAVVTGRDCRGRIDKILPAPSMPVLVSPGRPPEQGVWAPQGVRAVAAAKALSWREERRVEAAFVEYPFHGVVRRVSLTTRRRAEYRAVLHTVRGLDDPPARIHDDAKCGACEYRASCGVPTRSLRSLL